VTEVKHIGYPVPTEMWNIMEKEPKEDFSKHQAICDLLDIDLTCPHCKEVLLKASERKEKRKHS
tara:strand:+ start:3500 stop:3691 length:192 start_codon:yes stop_codon:yes gene_type:complete